MHRFRWLRIDDVSACFSRLLKHGHDAGWRMLHVLIHRDDPVGGRLKNSCNCRGVLSVVARQGDNSQPFILVFKTFQNTQRVVDSIVDDEYTFADTDCIRGGSKLPGLLVDFLAKRRDIFFSRIHRDYY